MDKTGVALQDVREAADRIRPYIRHTPLLREKIMDQRLGCEVYIKPEMLQITGAFKLRGAMNKILSLTQEERDRGIIASSSGNHAQACAFAGQLLGLRAVVVVPDDTPPLKVKNARAMGAEVILWDRSYTARWDKVSQLVAEHGYSIVHAFEDYDVMAGQGTIALEIMEDLPEIETVLVPVGGGGLISGIATAIKGVNPKIRVIGVQTQASPGYVISYKAGERLTVEHPTRTIADGITCKAPYEKPFPIIMELVDDVVAVSEEDIREAVRMVANSAKLIAEPSSCVGIAALLGGQVKTRPDEKVCAVITSGNWDIENLGKIYKDEPVEGVL